MLHGVPSVPTVICDAASCLSQQQFKAELDIHDTAKISYVLERNTLWDALSGMLRTKGFLDFGFLSQKKNYNTCKFKN